MTYHTNGKCRKRVKAKGVGGRLFSRAPSSGHYGGKDSSDPSGFEQHPRKTSEPKHDRNRNVLDLLDGVWGSRGSTKPFHPRVGDTVSENDSTLDHLSRDAVPRGAAVPSPAQIRVGTEVSSKSENTIPEEDASFNIMGCTTIDKTCSAHTLL